MLLLKSLVSSVVAPAATTAIALSEWQLLLAGAILGGIVNKVSQSKDEQSRMEKKETDWHSL